MYNILGEVEKKDQLLFFYANAVDKADMAYYSVPVQYY